MQFNSGQYSITVPDPTFSSCFSLKATLINESTMSPLLCLQLYLEENSVLQLFMLQGCSFYLYTVTFSVTSGHSGLCRLYCLATSRASMLNPGKRWSPSLKTLLRLEMWPNVNTAEQRRHKKKPNMIWSTLHWLWQLHLPEDFGENLAPVIVTGIFSLLSTLTGNCNNCIYFPPF